MNVHATFMNHVVRMIVARAALILPISALGDKLESTLTARRLGPTSDHSFAVSCAGSAATIVRDRSTQLTWSLEPTGGRDLLRRHLSRVLVACGVGLGISLAAAPVLADSVPSGERMLGNVAGGHGAVIEPAYDYNTGNLTYLLTPTGARSNANAHAIAPLYLVVYPPGTAGTFNCMGYHGNCPDHDWLLANAAVGIMPGEYGNDPTAVPGHDHLVGLANTGGDYNVAWHVYVELFTPGATVTHITTLTDLSAAWESGTISTGNTGQGFDSGITFNCSAVSAAPYWAGTPLNGS